MAGSTPAAPSATPAQRHYMRTLMRDLELPTDVVTVLHRDLFKKAGIAWRDGTAFDTWLSSLSKSDACELIEVLQERLY